MLRVFLPCVMLAVGALSLIGCGGGSALPAGATGTVSGVVTYEGQPIPEKCVVAFINKQTGIIGTGTVGPSGQYKLVMRDGEKILAGSYRVTVTPPVVVNTLSDDEIMKLSAEGKLPQPPIVKEVPDRYRSPESTPLTNEVVAGDNKIDIKLTEKE